MPAELDWDATTDQERRTVLDEFLVRLEVFPEHRNPRQRTRVDRESGSW
jgi:predicted Fe-S protein YdhL (DUF1289 family)